MDQKIVEKNKILISKLQEGNEKVWRELINKYSDKLFGYALSLFLTQLYFSNSDKIIFSITLYPARLGWTKSSAVVYSGTLSPPSSSAIEEK